MKVTLRGIFLTSEKPEVTAKFYRTVTNLELEEVGSPSGYVYWKIDSHGLQLAIHDAKQFADYTHPPCPDSNLTHLYFNIDNQPDFLSHLNNLGISPHATDDVVVTVADPDGRKVMFGIA